MVGNHPLYQLSYTRINTCMHTYDAITNTGLHIHLSMIEAQSFYILVHDFENFNLTIKFFTDVELAKQFIQQLG